MVALARVADYSHVMAIRRGRSRHLCIDWSRAGPARGLGPGRESFIWEVRSTCDLKAVYTRRPTGQWDVSCTSIVPRVETIRVFRAEG